MFFGRRLPNSIAMLRITVHNLDKEVNITISEITSLRALAEGGGCRFAQTDRFPDESDAPHTLASIKNDV